MGVSSVTWTENPFAEIFSPGCVSLRFFISTQKLRPCRNDLLWRLLPGNTFKTGFPYTTKPVIIIRFCDLMTGTPADNAHAGWAALAVSDLCGPFLKTALLSPMIVSELIDLPPYIGIKS